MKYVPYFDTSTLRTRKQCNAGPEGRGGQSNQAVRLRPSDDHMPSSPSHQGGNRHCFDETNSIPKQLVSLTAWYN
eukprot:scaffold59051_cov16-Prasinocladus_malaysianus.AAC.2